VVLPVAVTSARCWPRQAFIKYPGVIDVSFGPPMPATGRRPEALVQEVQAWIEAEMRRLDPLAYPDSPHPPQAPGPHEPPGAPIASARVALAPGAADATPGTLDSETALAGTGSGSYTDRP